MSELPPVPWNCARVHHQYPKTDVRYISDAQGNEVATLYCTLSIGEGRLEKAAHVLAAAPELLEALRKAVNLWDNYRIDSTETERDAKAEALAAIAKAEGQS